MREKLRELMDKYFEMFNEGYPLEQANELMEESIEYIEKCLKEGKPRKFEEVEDDENF